jgi:hypothetical protein
MEPDMSDDVIKYSSDKQEVISRAALPEDQEPEILSLRPAQLSAYVGQEEIVETFKIAYGARRTHRSCFISRPAGSWENNVSSHYRQ